MELSLGIRILRVFVMRKESLRTSLLPIPLNKMGLLKGRIELSLRLQEQCSMAQSYLNIFGLKLLELHATHKTDQSLSRDMIRPPMKFIGKESLTSATFMYLGVLCLFTITRITYENLMLSLMMDIS